jgi:SPP1 gp7 family putative phage head morphogenesis protein
MAITIDQLKKRPTSNYWKKRMEILEAAQLQKGQAYFATLEKQFKEASANIEKEIAVWYQRFAINNNISMAEAKQLLNTKELAEFRWDVKEYIKYGEENALNQKWMKELENASARVHISRLEALKLQMQQQVEVLYGNHTDGLDKLLRDIYSDGYYHTAWEIQKGFNIGWDLHDLNSNQLDKVLSKPWTTDGKTFSDRIWTNKQQLIGSLQTHLTQAVIRGQAPDKAIKSIAEEFRVSKNKAGRLVMTESAAFASASQRDAFNALNVKRFEIVATLDNRTSEICQELDGHVFNMKDFEVGVTAPPFHAWCRTTTVPYFDDNYGERAARGADGKVYYVPSNMKYSDWKKTFVDGGSKDGLEEVLPGNIIHNETISNFKNIYEQWDKKNVKDFASSIVNHENLPLTVQRYQLSGAKGQCQLNYRNPEMEVITYELNSEDIRDVEYQVKTAFHELFHAKSNGLVHDIGEISFEDWAYVDDIFAEATSHYIVKSIGINKELAPAYATHLINSLPKLKSLPEFSSCKTIADFGEVAYKFRFSTSGNAKWKSILNVVNNTKHDIIEYSKSYIDYIEKNKSELIDKLLENMPQYSAYKSNMIDDIDGAIKSINNGYNLSGNEKIIFENALIISMNRLGVK